MNGQQLIAALCNLVQQHAPLVAVAAFVFTVLGAVAWAVYATASSAYLPDEEAGDTHAHGWAQPPGNDHPISSPANHRKA